MSEQQQRRAALGSTLMENQGFLLFPRTAPIASADASYNYHFDRNIFYFTGITQEKTALLIYRRNGIHCQLFVNVHDSKIAHWVGNTLDFTTISEISGIDINSISHIDHLLPFLHQLKLSTIFCHKAEVMADLNQKRLLKLIEKGLNISLTDGSDTITALRHIKSANEVENIKQAINITATALEQARRNLVGKKEYQVAASLINTYYDAGADVAFPAIVAYHTSSLCLHHIPTSKEIGSNGLVLIDTGASYHGYAADISRTYPASGKFSDQEKQIYQIVLKMQQASLAKIAPGIAWKDVHLAARAVAITELTKLGIIQEEAEVDRYFTHSVGHPLGLDTHDLRGGNLQLATGMVMTVEPGLYLPELNIGIRIEDDVLVTENGAIILSDQIKKDLKSLEEDL